MRHRPHTRSRLLPPLSLIHGFRQPLRTAGLCKGRSVSDAWCQLGLVAGAVLAFDMALSVNLLGVVRLVLTGWHRVSGIRADHNCVAQVQTSQI